MNVAIILALGESWEEFESRGQDELFLAQRLRPYSNNFEHIYLFSYGKRSGKLLPNVELVGNKFGWHRFFYAFLLPLVHRDTLRDCLVVRGMQLTGALPALIAKYLFGLKVVINYGYDYAAVARTEGKYVRSWLLYILGMMTLPLCDAVIVTTSSLEQKVVAFYKGTVVLIPNGVDTRLFSPADRLPQENVLLYVGRLEPQKNVAMLVYAAAKLRPTCHLLVIGQGSLKNDLTRLAKTLRVKLSIIDSVPHDELPKFFKRARLFILPSLIEGHPKSLLEAMSCALPVIGTDVSGTREVITHRQNGLVVKNTPESLADAIETLLANRKLSEHLGHQARQTVKRNYNITILSQRDVSLIKKFGRS